jgi:lipopolysaccharide export system permease protein
MMKKLDRYILRNYLGTFVFMVGIILLIAIIFDVSEKVEDFTRNNASLKEILFDYYLSFIIYYGNQFSALMLFIAVIFFTSRLANRTEIVAILSSGVSFNRFLLPYFIGASIIFLGNLYLNNYLVPIQNDVLIDFTDKYIEDGGSPRYKYIHRKIDEDTYVFFESLNPDKGVGYHFSLEKFDGSSLALKMMADFARFDSIKQSWKLENLLIRKISQEGEEIERISVLDTIFNFVPSDLVSRKNLTETMTLPELNAFIEKEAFRGAENMSFYYVDKYKRFSLSFAAYILTLLGVTLSFRKKRGGIGANLAIGLGLVMIYIFFMQVSNTFATKGNLHPMLAVWIPNITFGLISLIFYGRAIR